MAKFSPLCFVSFSVFFISLPMQPFPPHSPPHRPSPPETFTTTMP
ncbi:hypothetical protein GLYMA_18G050750v4 [Glycine max]|nr:hypothetical protein GLYMA_18G050750v4 [Glycine max]KAH1153263.1 hypothetical protein GYH30_049081 [Glycine max]